MAQLYGKQMKREDILRHVGDITQVAGVRRFVLREGREEGVEAAELYTGTGFRFTVLIGRGMDISGADYRGLALAWRSATGDTHAAYYEPEGLSWLRSFFGGLVATCGLTTAGAPSTDQGQALGLHGRIGNTPAYAVWADGEWRGDDYWFWVQGKVRESIVFGENLVLTRRIEAKLGESRLWIHDRVENLGHEPSPLMMLYHINGGFPAVADGGKLLSASIEVCPRDEEAEKGKEEYARFQAPTPGYKEKVYYHDIVPDPNGFVTTALANEELGFGFYVRYRKDQLPRFTEWKMMGEGTYVVGMEPANCLVEGRAKERERGTLQYIQPGDVREFDLEIGVLDSAAALRVLAEELNALRRMA
ncbi:MAG: aldose 1-epimerase family protein [Armatimonadota bacterium]